MNFTKAPCWLLLTSCILAASSSISAQESLESQSLKRRIQEEDIQIQLRGSEREIAELSQAIRSLESRLKKDISKEDATHIRRESNRLKNELQERELQRRRLQQRHQNDRRRAEGNRRDLAHDHAPERGHPDEAAATRERLEHMHHAMEHLHAAGLHELAGQVEQRIHRFQARLKDSKREGLELRMRELTEQFELLSRQLRELRSEIQHDQD